MKLSHKQAGKRAWAKQRKQKASDLRRYRFRLKFIRTPAGIIRYKVHPLFV